MSRRGFVRLPPFGVGQKIGLLGGSFNPAHDGHRHISELAIRRLDLDRLWWLVTPGNPLKSAADLAALEARMTAARKVASDPRIVVTDIEAQLGLRYTYDVLRFLRTRAPTARFVWIMGADNLAQFPRWQRWREIADLVPLAIVDRPGSTHSALFSRAAHALTPWRRPECEGRIFPRAMPPALLVLHGPRSHQSSTALRQTQLAS